MLTSDKSLPMLKPGAHARTQSAGICTTMNTETMIQYFSHLRSSSGVLLNTAWPMLNVSTNELCYRPQYILSYLDAHVARVDAHHKTDEEITAIACHQAEQHQAQQTWSGSRVTKHCTTVWPQTCYTIR